MLAWHFGIFYEYSSPVKQVLPKEDGRLKIIGVKVSQNAASFKPRQIKVCNSAQQK